MNEEIRTKETEEANKEINENKAQKNGLFNISFCKKSENQVARILSKVMKKVYIEGKLSTQIWQSYITFIPKKQHRPRKPEHLQA